MIIGVHPDQFGSESYSAKWIEFLEARGVEVRLLDLLAPDALDQARGCSGVMWRWTHCPQDKQSSPRILYVIETSLGIPVFPDAATSWHYDEKVAQLYLLQSLGAPMPETWVFWDKERADQWARTAPYPVVFKLGVGAGSANVVRVNSRQEALELIRRSFERGVFPYTMNEFRSPSGMPRSKNDLRAMWARAKDAARYLWRAEFPALHPTFWKPERGYAYFQEFLPENDFDTRITVIGDRAFGFRRMNRPGDFRASGSGDFDVTPERIAKRCVEIAFETSQRGGFQSMAYDFLFKNDQPTVCEISYTFADWAVHECPGHWRRDLRWIEGQMWPEEAQVEMFLGQIEAGGRSS
jgi:glutathione synthase/RimK-type ligase-like ATP-grasp enzyme